MFEITTEEMIRSYMWSKVWAVPLGIIISIFLFWWLPRHQERKKDEKDRKIRRYLEEKKATRSTNKR